MKLWFFAPSGNHHTHKTPAIVFFFGGGWKGGSPVQFINQCEYLAARGMVAILADYRVSSRHGVTVNACVSDAKSAVRWIRAHASEFGVDPDRIAAGGGSAGGHLAAATAILPDFDETNEDPGVSSNPNALVLFNPAVILAPIGNMEEEFTERIERLKERLGAEPELLSPYHHVAPGLPPTIIFHGIDDNTVPFKSVSLFAEKMKQYGNDCKLVGYKNEDHGFFNYGRGQNGGYISTMYRMDSFLVSLGYLAPPPETIEYD